MSLSSISGYPWTGNSVSTEIPSVGTSNDLSPKGARDGDIDHVGIFVGFNDKGLPQIIDSSSGIGYIQYRNIDCCSGDSVSTNGISTIRRLGVS